MPTSQHDEQFAHWSSQSVVCVGRVKRQRTTSRAQSWSLVLPQTVMTSTRTLHGCCSRWHVRAGDCMWVSAVGGSGRRAVILRARMMGMIEPSVHEREPRFFPGISGTRKREGRTCMRHQNGQTFHLKLYGSSRMELGQECRVPKRCRCVMLRFVWLLRISLWPHGGRCAGIRHFS